MSTRDPWDELNFWCDYCGAQPGQPCRRSRGRTASPHVSRIHQANDAWKLHHPNRVKT